MTGIPGEPFDSVPWVWCLWVRFCGNGTSFWSRGFPKPTHRCAGVLPRWWSTKSASRHPSHWPRPSWCCWSMVSQPIGSASGSTKPIPPLWPGTTCSGPPPRWSTLASCRWATRCSTPRPSPSSGTATSRWFLTDRERITIRIRYRDHISIYRNKIYLCI